MARAHEFLGPADPAALAAFARTGIFARRGAAIRQPEIIVAARDGIGIGDVVRSGFVGRLCRAPRLRADRSIDINFLAHLPEKTLQNLYRIATGIDIHVKNGGLQHFRQAGNARPLENQVLAWLSAEELSLQRPKRQLLPADAPA